MESWPADAARAAIVLVVWMVEMYVGYVVMWALSWVGFVLFLAAVMLGPFGGARIACRLIPAGRGRVIRLGLGTISGLVLSFIVAIVIFGGNLRAQSMLAKGGVIYVVVAGVFCVPWLGALGFSRLKPRTPA